MSRFWAIVQYELLWNIRKKKFLGVVVIAFALTTLSLALPVILSNTTNQPLDRNPDYVVGSGVGIGGLGFFLFALVTVMDSISGEFESGTVVTLLTKPVSRTMVFLGKLLATFLTILTAYTILYLYMAVGGTIVYGPQSNLHLVPISLLGDILSTFVWVGLVLAIGSVSKSSIIVALGSFGIFLGLFIGAPIVSMFSEQAWVLSYVPGSGTIGFIKGLNPKTNFTHGMSISTGTDYIATNSINCILYPSSEVTFFRMGMFTPVALSVIELYVYAMNSVLFGTTFIQGLYYMEMLSFVFLRSILVASIYILASLFVAWYAFKRAQVLE